jgi:protein SCO1/2
MNTHSDPCLRSSAPYPSEHLLPAAVRGRHGVLVRLVARASAALLALATPGGIPRAADDSHPTPEPAASGPKRSTREYAVPAVRLVRDDGKVVSLPEEMNDGRPIVLNFIFTTCTSICPMMSSAFAQFERRLGAEADRVHLMSISIDPEHDTPERLLEYARKFHAGREWQHYTGTLSASVAAQRAFDVYRGGKMSHSLVTLMRAGPGKPWLRIEGWVTPDDLVNDYRELLASR